MKWRIQSLIMTSLLGTAIGVTLVFSVVLYQAQTQAVEQRIAATTAASAHALSTLAERAIAGANLMRLRHADSQALYEASGALYLKFEGTSDGSAASAFMAEIPPTAVSYDYHAKDSGLDASTLASLDLTRTGLIPHLGLYVYVTTLGNKHGGTLTGVFPATELKSLTRDVLSDVIPLAALVLLLVSVLSLMVARLLTRPIQQLTVNVRSMAEELNLGRDLPAAPIREIDEISDSIATLLGRTQSTLQHVSHSNQDILAATERVQQVTQTNEQDLLKQQQRLDFISSSILEMSASIKQVAGNAHHNVQEVAQSRTLVGEGQSIIAATVSDIHALEQGLGNANRHVTQLNQATRNIEHVLEVIGGIAEQTNLLALNAAIEAARAGEQGRGFAVVADEVRALASKTKDSTGEVNQIIKQLLQSAQDSADIMQSEVNRAEQTARHVEQATAVLVRIQDAINNIQTLSQQTATSTDEQAHVSNSLAEAVNELGDLAHTSVDNIGTTRSAVIAVQQQLDHMKQSISQFRLHS